MIGVTAGFLGGKVDAVLMRITESVWTFPALMLALAITSVLGRGLVPSMVAIGIVGIPFFARLSRASTLTARELDYVLAARALGSSSPMAMRSTAWAAPIRLAQARAVAARRQFFMVDSSGG